jgi:transcriptional regulator with XRE-family HTH domain
MATRERRIDRGRRRARHALATIGDEFRETRLAAGLTQRQVAGAVGISPAEESRIERGMAPWVTFETLVMIAAVLGLDLPLRAFPVGDPIRDVAQLALLGRFRALLPAGLSWRTEVPIRLERDLRAWDAVVGGGGWSVPVEAETRLRDVQALARRLALKRRDDGAETMILLIADTRHNRRALRLAMPDLVLEFPVSGRAVLAALSAGEQPSASGIVLLRPLNSRPASTLNAPGASHSE